MLFLCEVTQARSTLTGTRYDQLSVPPLSDGNQTKPSSRNKTINWGSASQQNKSSRRVSTPLQEG